MLEADPNRLRRKRLEEIRGFLIHISRTYSQIKPYLNGFHLSIDGWRPDRDSAGWRDRGYKKRASPLTGADFERLAESQLKGPELVKAVPRFQHDIDSMLEITDFDRPPLKRVRCSKTALVLYGVGDASGTGYGFMLQDDTTQVIEYEYAQWMIAVRRDTSSNWKELANFVKKMVQLGEEGRLSDVEIFAFTDNTTAEAAYHKGYSGSPMLDDLVRRLHVLEMQHEMIFHLIHVSGLRMIAQGTDGISRGDHATGSMLGQRIASFVPLASTALEREPLLQPWLEDICGELGPIFLSPEGGLMKHTHSERLSGRHILPQQMSLLNSSA